MKEVAEHRVTVEGIVSRTRPCTVLLTTAGVTWRTSGANVGIGAPVLRSGTCAVTRDGTPIVSVNTKSVNWITRLFFILCPMIFAGASSSTCREPHRTLQSDAGNVTSRNHMAEQDKTEDSVRNHHAALRSAAAQGRRSRIGTPPPRGGSSLSLSPSSLRKAARISESRTVWLMPGISRNYGHDSTAYMSEDRTKG